MRGNAQKYPDKQMSVAGARSQLSQLLAGCTDDRLASFTADGLGKMFRIKPAEIEAMLFTARTARTIKW